MSDRLLIVDGDIVAFRCAAKNEESFQFGESTVWESDIEQALIDADDYLDELQDDLQADRLVVALSDRSGHYHRRDIYPPYKQNRAGKRRPPALGEIRARWEHRRETVEKAGLEADDVLGILATAPQLKKYASKEKVICTIDKDLWQIPGLIAHFDDRDIEETTPEAGLKLFYTQTLTGDATDNYPGVQGVGPVKASKLLDESWDKGERAVWEAIVAQFEQRGQDEEFALAMARCARILRAEDYDFKTRQPILWSPPDE